MRVEINDKEVKVKEGIILLEFLEEMGYTRRAAVWINDKQLLQEEYSSYRLEEGDKLRVIRPLGGG